MSEHLHCPECGATAIRTTIGHLFSIQCPACGYEQSGTFSPVYHGLEEAKPVEVFVDLQGLPPTGNNLLAFSRLDSRFDALKPAELKAAYLAGHEVSLGCMYNNRLEEVTALATSAGFKVRCGDPR